MINKEFSGILMKYTNIPPSGDSEPCVQVSIKHTSEGDIQNLMSHFESALETENIQRLFAYPVKYEFSLLVNLADCSI